MIMTTTSYNKLGVFTCHSSFSPPPQTVLATLTCVQPSVYTVNW